jgi:cytosine/adenosine deaminase-related metal-dependent hydrolase
MAAYIGRWDEPKPSDQTDFDLRRRLDLAGIINAHSSYSQAHR